MRVILPDKRELTIKFRGHPTYSQILVKIRQMAMLGIHEHEGLFLIADGVVPMMSKIADCEVLEVCRESVFGAWNKAFVKAGIKKIGNAYVAKITYSFFGLYHYEELEAFPTLQEAKDFILKQRTDGHLSIENV